MKEEPIEFDVTCHSQEAADELPARVGRGLREAGRMVVIDGQDSAAPSFSRLAPPHDERQPSSVSLQQPQQQQFMQQQVIFFVCFNLTDVIKYT